MAFAQKPNWGKWGQVLDVRLWEGVALSLDIEPHPYGASDTDLPAEFWISDESKELDERLFVATRNLPSAGGLAFTQIVTGDPSRSMVRLRQFAEWALSLGWNVPREFEDLASRPRETENTGKAGVEAPLEGKGRATALKLILGMAIKGYGYDPIAVRSPIPKQIADDLLLLGITLTDETVRKWLRIAVQEVECQPRTELSE